MSKRLYVGNLAFSVTDEALYEVFIPYGKVVSANVIKYRDSGRSKGFGFVEMEEEDAASSAMAALNGQDVEGRPVKVSEARPPVATQ